MKKYIILLICVLSFMHIIIPSSNKIVPASQQLMQSQTSASGMCVLECSSGRILNEYNKDEQLACASTTKILTAITVLENCKDLEQIIKVDKRAVGVEGTSIYLNYDEEIKVIDLLYGLMLRSGNDAATALAYFIGGDLESFADKMNITAKKAGANNSHFANPHGLDDKNHYTTAYDLAKITAYALENLKFSEIVSTKSYVIPATNNHEQRYLRNKNRLLTSLDGCIGVKTGYTSKAGRCLVSAIEREGMKVVCVVLNCGPMFEESQSMLNSVYDDYDYAHIMKKESKIFNEYYIEAKQGRVYLYATEDYYYPLKHGEQNKIKVQYSTYKLDKNVEANEIVGEAQIYFDNQLLKTIKLATINQIDVLTENEILKSINLQWME